MDIIELFSKRKNNEIDIYIYDSLPDKLRIQIKYIIEDFLSQDSVSRDSQKYAEKKYWDTIYKILTREHGVRHLSYSGISTANSQDSQVTNYLLQHPNVDEVIDTIEIAFRCIENFHHFANGTTSNASYDSIDLAIKILTQGLEKIRLDIDMKVV